jgi:hypothetical protein
LEERPSPKGVGPAAGVAAAIDRSAPYLGKVTYVTSGPLVEKPQHFERREEAMQAIEEIVRRNGDHIEGRF